MVVACPRCKSKLKFSDEKIRPEGTKIRCPRCQTALLVKKPAAQVKGPAAPPPIEKPAIPVSKPVAPVAPPLVEKPFIPIKEPVAPMAPAPARKRVLIAHAEAGVLDGLKAALSGRGFEVLHATDGKTALIKAIKGAPAIALLDVALPVVSGYQLSVYIKKKLAGIKTFLIVSASDERRRRKGPASAYGAVDYIEEGASYDTLLSLLGGATGSFTSVVAPPKPEPKSEIEKPFMSAIKPIAPPAKVEKPFMPAIEPVAPPKVEKPFMPAIEPVAPPKVEKPFIPAIEPVAPPVSPGPVAPPADPGVERAKRLVRAVLSDLELYSPKKVEDAIREGNFKESFAKELKEGVKHYENRIPVEIRNKADFFGEELGNFIERKKKAFGF